MAEKHLPCGAISRGNVVITGASAGIGRAAVRRFAGNGYDVAMIARGVAGLEAAANDVFRSGRQALVLPCDVSDPDAVEDAASRVEDQLGPIDIWVNNAMVSVFSPIREMTAAEFRRVTEVTYLGYVHGTLAALHRMLPRNRGTIVQVGSALAFRSIPLQSAYCAAKHAINGFTESLRCELIHDGSQVHVTEVHMPAVNTPQFNWVKSRMAGRPQPVPPIFQPEVAADAIYFAAHNKRRAMWIGGPTIKAIIADKIVPGLLDRYLAATGYSSQQTDEPEIPDRPHNLWQAVDDEAGSDHGAHGRFDNRARSHSIALVASKWRPWIQSICVGLTGVAAGTLIGTSVLHKAEDSRRRTAAVQSR